MKKIVIFTEGQSELIFVRRLLFINFGYQSMKLNCLELYADKPQKVPYHYEVPIPLIEFQLINVANDSKVLSAIKEREAALFREGVEEIIGLRDMYSQEYKKRSNCINMYVNRQFIEAHESQIQKLSNPQNIHIFFSVMELEAWLLSMYNLFSKIDTKLTVNFIEQNIHFNLRQVNPEIEFFHPTHTLNRIFVLIGQTYNKGKDQIESIVAKIVDDDITNALENNRCRSFCSFLNKLNSYKQ